MSFAALADRYGMELPMRQEEPDELLPEEIPQPDQGAEPPAELPETPLQPEPRFYCWQDSEAVLVLSTFVARHKSLGLQICQADGVPVLEFKPGLVSPSLGAAAERRWNIGLEAADLLLDAAPDLFEMIETGLITLPPAKK